MAIRLYQKFWKKNELSNFSRLLNASARITFWTLPVKADLFFPLFNVFLCFRGQSPKQTCLWFAIFNFSEKLQDIFERGLSKYGVSASSEKINWRNSAKYVNQKGNIYFWPKLKTAISLSIFHIFEIFLFKMKVRA